ncbi:antitoxin [Luteipulveratus flavus]|uniref:Antitoxin n=1 Tax=Luteipulveratus flavus TaxID=3031728 RepID=A0ABT6C2K1_9MICO|nr:antitoxin [Luteipulveratus sp. YIM 133296]MDF8263030.1 antitoxin [Luteipulveratus sp. YIM 133296]
MAISDLINKARQWASKNPDKTRQAIDKVEDAVDSRTGGKYRDKVDQAGDAVGGQLGIPKEQQGGGTPTQQPGQTPTQQPGQTQPGQTQPGQTSPGQTGQQPPSAG